MSPHDIATLSAELVLSYYGGSDAPFVAACHDDVLWIGPATGQSTRGRMALARRLADERGAMRFCVHDLSATPLATDSPDVCVVVLAFLVDALWPDGSVGRANQRVQLTWTGCQGRPRILVCHVSDAVAADARGVAYPLARADTQDEGSAVHAAGKGTRRVCLRGCGHTTIYLDASDVIFAESKGAHALVHTTRGTLEAAETLSAIARRYPALFVRCHASYLVNPTAVRGVERCRATLADGSVVPIPEKRYTAVRRELAERLGAA